MNNNTALLSISLIILIVNSFSNVGAAAQSDQSSSNTTTTSSSSTTKKLFAYAGPLLPNDWQVVSILNENRAVIGFNNGSARNSMLVELDPRDRIFLEKLQNGTIYTTPLSSAKEKIAQWSSSVSSTVTKFGKSVKDQFDSLLSNNKPTTGNMTTPIVN